MRGIFSVCFALLDVPKFCRRLRDSKLSVRFMEHEERELPGDSLGDSLMFTDSQRSDLEQSYEVRHVQHCQVSC